MQKLNVGQQYDWLITTLSRYNPEHLRLSDDNLEYLLFEELDIECVSFLHEKTVDVLIKYEMIPAELREDILQLREDTLRLMRDQRSVDAYRNTQEWEAVRNCANTILDRLDTSKE